MMKRLLALFFSVVACAQADDVWTSIRALNLTTHQREQVEQLEQELNQARARMKDAADTDVPPDRLLQANLDYVVSVRLVNRRIDEILTEEQRYELKRPPAPSDHEDKESDPEKPPVSIRRPPRPVLTDGEYREQAVQRRSAYSKSRAQWPAPALDDEAKPHFVELGLMPPVPFPAANPYSAAKADLGKMLFHDPRLSGSGQISCANCHDADLGWGDGRTVSFGHGRKVLPRNAPSILNAGHLNSLFWDGRAASLEQQAADVIMNVDEMRGIESNLVAQLDALPGYTNAFAAAFGTPAISLDHIAAAIATFERTIASRASPFDTFLRGDTNAMSDAAIRGLHLFRTDARCINCHMGPALTDGRFHNEGLTYYGRKYEDLGRYNVTKQPDDVGAFKTPSLRNVLRTAPYMHLGLFDLDGVLNMYNAGMADPRPKPGQEMDPLFPKRSKLLRPLGLNSADLSDLRAFLESLTETRSRVRQPPLPGRKNN